MLWRFINAYRSIFTPLYLWLICLKFYLFLLLTWNVLTKHFTSAHVMLRMHVSMLASGCAACYCELPVVGLHFTLFNLGSLVCKSQLASLLIRASPLNMSACYNACWLVIFAPTAPGWWVNVCRLSVSMTEGEREKKDETFAFLNTSITTVVYSGHICPRLFSMKLITLTHSMFQSQLKWIRWPTVFLPIETNDSAIMSCRPSKFVPLLIWHIKTKQVFCEESLTFPVFSFDSVKRLHHLSTQQW